MPWRPLPVCSYRDPVSGRQCTQRSLGNGRCLEHERLRKRLHNLTRGTTTQRGYGSEWTRIRRAHLVHQPACVVCGTTTDVEVHHLIALRDGGTHDRANLVTCCQPHHAQVTVATNMPRHSDGRWK